MSVALVRVDDRLIHGQVVIAWGRPLGARFIVLVDDVVAASPWEQELYRMGVPPDIDVLFASVADAAARFAEWQRDPRVGIVLAGDIATLVRLRAAHAEFTRVNIGGIHHRPGRAERLRYVYLTDEEAAQLRALAEHGVDVSAQDVPTAPAVPVGRFT